MKELFVEYEEIKKEHKDAKKEYDKTLEKKALYAYSILPGGSKADNSISKNNTLKDKFLAYTIKMSEIDKEIEVRRNLADVLAYRLKLKLLDLRESKDVLDKIYVYRYIDRLPVNKFYRLVGYSKKHIYRKLEEISKKIEMTQNVTKLDL